MSKASKIKKRKALGNLQRRQGESVGVSEAQRRAYNALRFLPSNAGAVDAGLLGHLGALNCSRFPDSLNPACFGADLQQAGKVIQQTAAAAGKGVQQAAQAVENAAQQTVNRFASAFKALQRQQTITPKIDPKVKPNVQNFIDVANANLSKAVGPELNAFAVLTGMNARDKAALVQAPLNFFLHLFNPVTDFLHTIVDRVTQRSGKTKRHILPGVNIFIDMRTVQPQDAKYKSLDPDTFDFYWTFRLITQFLVCCLTALDYVFDEIVKLALKQPVGKNKLLDLGAFRMRRQGLGVVGYDDAAEAGTVVTATGVGAGTVTGMSNFLKEIEDFFNAIMPAVKGAGDLIKSATKGTGQPDATSSPVDPNSIVVPPSTGGLLHNKTLLLAGAGVLGVLALVLVAKR